MEGPEDYTTAKLIEDIKGHPVCIDIHSSNIFFQSSQVRLNNDYDADITSSVKIWRSRILSGSILLRQ